MTERWHLVIGGWCAYVLYYVGRVNFSIAVPEMESAMGLTAGQIGVIAGAFFWVYAFAGVGTGWLADRQGARWLVGLGLFGSGVMNLVFVRSGTFPVAVGVWGLNGVFQAMGWAPLLGGLSRWLSSERAGSAAAAFGTSFVAGTSLAFMAGGWLLDRRGFSAVFDVAGIVLILGGLGWWLLAWDDQPARRPPRPIRAAGQATARMVVPLASTGVAYIGLLVWTPLYLVDVHGFSLPVAGSLSAGVLGVAAVVTLGITPAFRPGSPNRVVVLLALTAAALALVPVAWSPWTGVALLALATVLVSASSSVLLGVFPRLVDASRVAAVGGVFALAFNLGGGLGSPLLGVLIGAGSWGAMFTFMAGCALAGAGWMRIVSPIPTTRARSMQ